MQDLFIDYEQALLDYRNKKSTYKLAELHQSDILSQSYSSLVEVQPGNDLLCLDYMDFSTYTKMVAQQFVQLVHDFEAELKNLELDIKRAFNLKNALSSCIMAFSKIPVSEFIQLLTLFSIPYQIKYRDGKRILVIYENDEEVCCYFLHSTINLVDFYDDELGFNLVTQHKGEDIENFIRFYINFCHQNRGKYCSILEVYNLYLKEKITLV